MTKEQFAIKRAKTCTLYSAMTFLCGMVIADCQATVAVRSIMGLTALLGVYLVWLHASDTMDS